MSRKVKIRNVFRIDVPPEEKHEDYRDFEGRIPYGKNIFDENGNLIGEDRYDDDGNLIGRMLYKYDENNHLTGEETYDETGELEEKLSYERDDKGRVLKKFVHYLDGSVDTMKYGYVGDNLTHKVLIDEDGEVESEEKFTFDGDKLVKEEKYDFGELIEKNEFKFDEAGNVVEARLFKDGESFTIINEYDENGNRTGSFKYDEDDQLIEKKLYSYDATGNMVEVKEEDRTRKSTVKMGYDEKGNATSQVEVNAEGFMSHEVFREYDDEGKLTEVRATLFKPVISGKEAYANTIQTVAAISEANAGDVVMPDRKYILVYEYEYWD
jgi:uncharacterized protein RhaS with RHS repeats